MFDPFAAALDALFSAPGSAAAVYLPVEGEPVPIRVIRSQPDDVGRLGGTGVIMATNLFEIRKSEVAEPDRRAMLALGAEIIDDVVTGGQLFSLNGEARLDVEGLTWVIGAEPV